MTSSNGNIFHVTCPLCGEFTRKFPSQRPMTRFDIFFDSCLNKWLSKQSSNRDAGSLRRHRSLLDVTVMYSEVNYLVIRNTASTNAHILYLALNTYTYTYIHKLTHSDFDICMHIRQAQNHPSTSEYKYDNFQANYSSQCVGSLRNTHEHRAIYCRVH